MYLPVNLANVQAATGFDYPAGKYRFKVTRTEIKANQDGAGQRFVVHNEIVMGPGATTTFQGRPLANSYQLSEKGAPFLKRLYLSCGIDDAFIAQNGGNVAEEWLHSKEYVATVVKNGNFTNITNEQPLSEWSNQPTQAQAMPTAMHAPSPSLLQPVTPPQQMMPQAMQMPGVMSAPGLPPVSGYPQGFQAPPPPPGAQR